MKKMMFILFAFTFTATQITAQENETDFREKLQFGVKIGTNYSNVYDSKTEDLRADGKLGFAAGIFTAIPIGKYLGLQPEIMFSQKGFKGEGKILFTPYKFKRTTNYIDVPLFFVLKPSEFFTFLAGPQYSYLLSQKDYFKAGDISTEQEQEFGNDDVRKHTLGFAGGFDVNVKHLILGFRAGVDLQNNRNDNFSSTPRYKNVYYQFTLGYRFY